MKLIIIKNENLNINVYKLLYKPNIHNSCNDMKYTLYNILYIIIRTYITACSGKNAKLKF